MKQALVVISFGTTQPSARKSIERMEYYLFEALGCDFCYRAFTSAKVIHKIREQEHVDIPRPGELLKKLAEEGYTHILCQPLQVIPGADYDRLYEEILSFIPLFEEVRLGKPLLYDESDCIEAAQALPSSDPGRAVLYMGHGSVHEKNEMYSLLQNHLPRQMELALLSGTPSLKDALSFIREKQIELRPLMMVSGVHILHEMLGEEPSSWKNQLLAKGYQVSVSLTPLLELSGIREILVRHAKEAEILK